MKLKIFVIKNNVPIGTLTEDKRGNITFSYLDDIQPYQYLINLKDKINTSNSLFPVFENLLPETDQLNEIRAMYSIKREIDLLLHLEDIHGSFEFFTEDDFSKMTFEKNETFAYADVREQILQNGYTFPNILNEYSLEIPSEKLYPSGSKGSKVLGISGFQYKFSVNINDNLKKISFDTKNNSEYIMKPYNLHYSKFAPNDTNSTYIPYLLINEHIFVTLARDFGFDVPYNGIIKHNDDYHYIIKRYDRYNGLKIDHHEVLTLLGKESRDKYDVTCKELIEVVSNYLDNDEILKLFKFLVFSVVISHGDLHAKNISLIYKTNSLDEKSMTLAPFYDISTIKIYKGILNNDIGMNIRNKKKDINIDELLWLADTAHISRDKATEIIQDISSKFLATFKRHIQQLPPEIKQLPVYTNRYRKFDTLEKVFDKFYKNRKEYIERYLFPEEKRDVSDLWE